MSVGKYEHTGERKRYSYRHRTVLSEDVQGSKELYDKVHLEKDFSLYNTPVLDFIQVTQKRKLLLLLHWSVAVNVMQKD